MAQDRLTNALGITNYKWRVRCYYEGEYIIWAPTAEDAAAKANVTVDRISPAEPLHYLTGNR